MNKKLVFTSLLIVPLITSCGLISFPSEESVESSILSSSEDDASSSFNKSSEQLSSLEYSSSYTSIESSSEQAITDAYYYEDFFNPSSEIKLTIKLSNEAARDICSHGSPSSFTTQDIYSPVDVTISVNGVEKVYQECGMRIKGNMSRGDSENFFSNNGQINGHGHFKIAFNETFDEGLYDIQTPTSELKARRFGKAKKIDIKYNRNLDENFVRESYASYMFENEGMLSQKINLAKIKFITDSDEKEYIYQVQEVIDDKFLERRLDSSSSSGDLYKCGWQGNNNLSLTSSISSLMGVEDKATNKTFVYDLKTNKKKSTHQDLVNLINTLTSSSKYENVEQQKEKIENVVDIDYFLRFAALEWCIANPDSMRYNYNNTYLYFSSKNHKLYPIMFDNYRSLGIKTNDWNVIPTRWPTSTKTVGNDWGDYQINPLYLRTVCDVGNENYPLIKDYQDRYLEYVEEYINKYLNVESFDSYLSSFYLKDNVYSSSNMSFASFALEMNNLYQDCMRNR